MYNFLSSFFKVVALAVIIPITVFFAVYVLNFALGGSLDTSTWREDSLVAYQMVCAFISLVTFIYALATIEDL